MKALKIFYFLNVLSVTVLPLAAEEKNSWAQKTLEKMTQDEKIGQLFMIAGYIDREYAEREIGNPEIIEEIENYITHYYVGGIAYVGPSDFLKQAAVTNHYQEISKYPILFAQDLEWGLSMRIKDVMRFPKNITLGAIKENRLIYEMGKEVGRQAKLIGIHMNLSPVLDVNIEPENISINVRSFGDSPTEVAEKGIAMILGLQDAGIIASAKHFPGLGDISIDPHLGLPYSPHDKKRLQEVELYPFVQAIKAGVMSIQTEHLLVPVLEPDLNTPSSLSPKIVSELLKKELGFSGLVISGALRMKALTNHLCNEEIVLKAFLAGSDMLLMPQDFPKAWQTLKQALAEKTISERDLDERVLKILQMKEKVKLNDKKIISLPSAEELHTPSGMRLKKELYQNAVSLLRDHNNLTPLSPSRKKSVAYVQLGDAPSNEYLQTLQCSLSLDPYIFSFEQDISKEKERLFNQINDYSLIILAVYPADPRRIEQIRLFSESKLKEELKHFRVHGISESFLELINSLQIHHEKTVVALFGNPFGLHFFDGYSTLIMAYEPDPDAQKAAAKKLYTDNINETIPPF